MATCTFAPNDAPTHEHMRGLVKALAVWRGDVARRRKAAVSRAEQAKWAAWAQAYDQIIDLIEDSNSMHPEPTP